LVIDHRKRFNQSPHRSHFHEAIASSWLQDAVTAAYLEAIDGLPVANDQYNAMANSLRIDGMRKFIERFCNLTEQTPPAKTETRANLEHRI
jgi:hypothetical protein